MEPHPTSSPSLRRGFSLLVTLPLLLLLLTIATGFVALTSTTVRQKGQAPAEAEAQANARLALMLAIAELQKQLGPDRRVSAPAGILDASPNTLPVDGVAHPHWVGVWSTELQGAIGVSQRFNFFSAGALDRGNAAEGRSALDIPRTARSGSPTGRKR